MTLRDKDGHFQKGVSGNPTGRPKSAKVTATDIREYARILREAAKSGDIGEAAVWLCQRANDTSELFKITKEFACYLAPKKSSVKTEVNEVKTLKIVFADKETNDIKIVGADAIKLIEEEVYDK